MSSVLRAGAAVRRRLLDALYDSEVGDRVAGELERMLAAGAAPRGRERLWDERDAWLITYPDQFRRAGEAPLATLRTVMEEDLEPWLDGLHVTPFFPWTSDDGFAVTDYLAVDERYGTWADVEALGRGRRLVADAVVNH
ncbi:MAG: alpha-amylase family glycosyl hydrolase, partial [Thermoleophilia bacterium]